MKYRIILLMAAVVLSASPCWPKGQEDASRRVSPPSVKALVREGFTVSRNRVAAAKFDNISRVQNPAGPGINCASYFIGVRVELLAPACVSVRDGVLVFSDGSEEPARVFGVLTPDRFSQWEPGRPLPLCPKQPTAYLLMSLYESAPPATPSRVPTKLRLTLSCEARKGVSDTVEVPVRP